VSVDNRLTAPSAAMRFKTGRTPVVAAWPVGEEKGAATQSGDV